jgi:SAM-dependent methyltransferase
MDTDLPASRIDTHQPDPARRYNSWHGGKDNFAVDRAAADEVTAVYPGIMKAVKANRDFLTRAIDLAALHGRRQFLDIGCGLPLPNATHEVAQAIDPWAAVAYVDNNVLSLSHARALYTSTQIGDVTVIEGDLRTPSQILADLANSGSTIDLRKPVVVVLGAVLHFLTDADQPAKQVQVLMDALVPGSVLIVSHSSYEPLDEETRQALTTTHFTGAGTFTPRSREEILGFFQGVELIQPGLAVVSQWRPDPTVPQPAPDEIAAYGGVGVKTGQAGPAGANLIELTHIEV